MQIFGLYVLTARRYWELRNRLAFLELCLSEVAEYNDSLNSGEGQPYGEPRAPDGHDYNEVLNILGL